MENNADVQAGCHEIVTKVLNREVSLAALAALDSALDPGILAGDPEHAHERTIIAFDTNVFLKLSNHRRSADIIDFLRTAFPGKLLLPGQVIQEFWNNLNVVETLASRIKMHSDNLKREVEKVDSEYGDFAGRFQNLLDEFQSRYGYIYDEGTLRRIKGVVSLLSEKAIIPYCRRSELSSTAAIRKRTKTPPGFKDELDGDFFVWADLLLGVENLRMDGFTPALVVLVTNDSKPDWSRNGIPHPILSAEMKALCGASFQIWSLDDLAKLVPA
jgi:PIN like domain